MTELPFKPEQWYKAKLKQSSSATELLPYLGYYIESNAPEFRVNLIQLGVRSFVARMCSVEQFMEKIDVNTPLTLEEAKALEDSIYRQIEKYKEPYKGY